HVAEAVARLRSDGLPVMLDFVGPGYPPALSRLRETLSRLDPEGSFLRYRGEVPFAQLHQTYQQADAFVFASSCENLPNILLEAMSSGLPVACSRCSSMPEVLGNAGVYFNPEDPGEIAEVLRGLLLDPKLRHDCAQRAFERSQGLSWERCARETLQFLAAIAEKHLAGKRPSPIDV
ncbi:MAG: glycosyltransferase, partial [Terriglobales bacterium]